MTTRGIDVSEHNGMIDWQKVKNSGIQFAIIRSSWGHFVEDKMFRRNVAECERVGMPYGFYHYSYSFDDTTMQQEAKGFANLIQQFRPTYPCYVDMEDDGFLAGQGVVNDSALLTRIAKYFCQTIESVNYYAGIYANLYWFQTKLYSSELDAYDKWLAQWASAPTFNKPFGMWQYTSDGSVPGSSARTDMNIAYKDYPAIIAERGMNNSNGKPTPPDPEPNPGTSYKVGDVVTFNEIFTSSTSTQALTPAITRGTITKVIPGARNPYLINDGTGWINDNSIVNGGGGSTTDYNVGDHVSFHTIYVSSTSTQGLTPAITSGTITQVIPGARNPYLINNGTGWINDASISSSSGGSGGSIQVGSKVRVRLGATDYNGASLAPFVYQTTYTVMEINGNRAVIGIDGAVTAAIAVSNLYLV